MVRTAVGLVIDVLRFVGLGLRSHARVAAENLFLRKQLALYLVPFDRTGGELLFNLPTIAMSAAPPSRPRIWPSPNGSPSLPATRS